MQTFLPYPDFRTSAEVLDNKRLGKQRVECKQILLALAYGGAWQNHPAVRMWRGHSTHLIRYYRAICKEWEARGYQHHMRLPPDLVMKYGSTPAQPPEWLCDPRLHRSHRSNLKRKDPVFYDMWPDTPDYLPYYWPVDL